MEGWAGVTPAESEDTLRFADLRAVRPMTETYPLERGSRSICTHVEWQRRVSRCVDHVNVHWKKATSVLVESSFDSSAAIVGSRSHPTGLTVNFRRAEAVF